MDIVGFEDEQDLLTEVIKQLDKDLMLAGIHLEFEETEDFAAFAKELEDDLQELFQCDQSTFSTIMYCMDVLPELIIAHQKERTLSQLVLKRELQKVVTRRQFSNKSN